MRQEYISSSGSTTFIINSIKDFLSNFDNLYTLLTDDGINVVYHVINYDIDLVFTRTNKAGKQFVACFLVKEFVGSGEDWFEQADNLVKWVGTPVQFDIYNYEPGLMWRVMIPVYYPCMVLYSDATKIVANYNSENDTIMFSSFNTNRYSISGVGSFDYIGETCNLIISDSEKYLDFNGGFFIAGDHSGCMEICFKRELTCMIVDGIHYHSWGSAASHHGNPFPYDKVSYFIADSHANCGYFHVYPSPFICGGGGDLSSHHKFVNYPYLNYNTRVRQDNIPSNTRNMPDITKYSTFEVIMYGQIDNAPYRNRGETARTIGASSAKTPGLPSFCYDPMYGTCVTDGDAFGNTNIRRYADWCTSCQPNPRPIDTWTDSSEGRIEYFYPILVPSITNSTIKVPRYEPLLSADMLDNGHNVNLLNDISMVMPLYMSVRRDPPEEPLSYSAVCRNDVINLVNMRYMSTNKMTNGIYPVEEHTYNCFNIGHRRNLSGFKGYQGIAFRQEDEE